MPRALLDPYGHPLPVGPCAQKAESGKDGAKPATGIPAGRRGAQRVGPREARAGKRAGLAGVQAGRALVCSRRRLLAVVDRA